MPPSRLLTRFASRMARALGLAPKWRHGPPQRFRPLIAVRYHTDDCQWPDIACPDDCETYDQLRGRIKRIVRELDE